MVTKSSTVTLKMHYKTHIHQFHVTIPVLVQFSRQKKAKITAGLAVTKGFVLTTVAMETNETSMILKGGYSPTSFLALSLDIVHLQKSESKIREKINSKNGKILNDLEI